MKIRKKQTEHHRQWMIRSNAFYFTNLSFHALTFVLHNLLGLPYSRGHTFAVYATFPLLLLLEKICTRSVRSARST